MAGAELTTRFDHSVSVRDGLFIIHDPVMGDFDMTVLPLSSPWSVHCGIGASVLFGAGVVSDSDNNWSGEMQLAVGVVPVRTCDVAAPILAKHILALQGQPTPPSP